MIVFSGAGWSCFSATTPVSPAKITLGFALCCVQLLQLCLTLCSPMDCSPSGSSDQGIFQARILEQGAISSSRGSSRPWDWTCVSCIDRRILYYWATREAPFGEMSTQILCLFLVGLFVFSSLNYKTSLYILDKRSPTSGPQTRPSQVRKQATQQEVSDGNS